MNRTAELVGTGNEHYLVYGGKAHRIEPEGSEAFKKGRLYRSTFSRAFIRQGILGSMFFQASYMVRGYGCALFGNEEDITPHPPQPASVADGLPLVAVWVIDNGYDKLVWGDPLK